MSRLYGGPALSLKRGACPAAAPMEPAYREGLGRVEQAAIPCWVAPLPVLL